MKVFRLFLLTGLWISLTASALDLKNADATITHLQGPAQSVVSLSPNLTEMIFAVGAGSKLKATVEWSDYPPAARTLPRIGDAFRIDLEQLLKLKPDLVLAWSSGNPAAVLKQIEGLGIPVWRTEISSPEEIADLLERIGKALGTQPLAEQAASQLRLQLRQLKQQYAASPAFNYFFQLQPKPLYTVNGQHLISRAISVCNGHNIFADLPALAPVVSREAVINAAPEIIFYTRTETEKDNQSIQAWSPWLGRGDEPDYIALNPDWISRPGPRLLKGIKQACSGMVKVGIKN